MTLIRSTTVALLIIFSALAVFVAVPVKSHVSASSHNQQRILGQLCDSQGQDIGANCDPGEAESSVTGIMRQVIEIALWIAGVVSAGVLIIGGMMYVFSGGSPEQTARAQSAIIYAIVGVVVAFSALAIINFAVGEINPAESTLGG